MKELKKHYQNLVIGFGKGGKTLAAYLANHGQDVALVEKSEMMYGGTCINVACIPTKSFYGLFFLFVKTWPTEYFPAPAINITTYLHFLFYVFSETFQVTESSLCSLQAFSIIVLFF